MNHSLLLRVTAPAVLVGLILSAACLAGVGYINRLQRNLADILTQNVTSLQAAQELEISVRQLRFRSLLFLSDPTAQRTEPIDTAQQRFEESLEVARSASSSLEEERCLGSIEAGYQRFRAELARLRATAVPGQPVGGFHTVADTHPIQMVVDPCQELSRINKAKMDRTAEESQRLARQGNLAMLLLGIVGPVGGLVAGYGMAKGLRRSIYKLSVRVQDMAQHLDRDVATVSVASDGDFRSLDRQMQQIVQQVEEVAARAQRQQSELLRAEQLAAVGQLAAGVAHEVRNPVAGIKMLVEAAMRPSGPRPLDAEDFRVIHRELGRVERTVQGLLDYARLPAPNRRPCEIGEVVRAAVEVVRARAEQRRVAIRSLGPAAPAVGDLDRDQIHTVLVNLLFNAVEATPDGGPIDIVWEPPSAGAIRLTVSDSGIGIPAEAADRLFTPFATTKPSGTGLGLSLSKRIVEEHGGSISVVNRPGGGACVAVSLPGPSTEVPA